MNHLIIFLFYLILIKYDTNDFIRILYIYYLNPLMLNQTPLMN